MAAFLVVYDPSKGKEDEMVAALHRWGATRIFRGAWVLGRANVDPRGHGGASGSGVPAGERNGQYRHGERTKAAIAEQQKFSALLKMLRAGVT